MRNTVLKAQDQRSAKKWSAGLYLRLSREDGDKYESDSITSQRELLLDFINRNSDITVFDIYEDDGWTGTNFDRPNFKRMEDDLRAKRIDCIIVKDLSRFARNCIEIGNYLSIVFPYTNKITPIFVDEQLPYADEKEAKRIYHVHGLIPKYFDYNRDFTADNAYTKWLRSAEARHIVLTEDSYEEIAHSNYKWRNTVQADTLVRYNCFIFGFSASDRNFKRLTRLVDWHQNEINGPLISQPVKHYIFLTIDEYLKGIFHESLPRQRMSNTKRTEKFYSNLISLKNAKGDKYDTETLVAKFQFLYYTLRSKRKYLRRFHIYPIWTTVSDLRNRVESIIKYTDFNNN